MIGPSDRHDHRLKSGFVFLSGSANPQYVSGCAFCAVHLRFHDVEANIDTVTDATVINETTTEELRFQLVGSGYDVNGGVLLVRVGSISASALYFRFNGAGTWPGPARRPFCERTCTCDRCSTSPS